MQVLSSKLKDATVASSSEDEPEIQKGSAAGVESLQKPGGTPVQRMLDRSRRRVQSCSPNMRLGPDWRCHSLTIGSKLGSTTTAATVWCRPLSTSTNTAHSAILPHRRSRRLQFDQYALHSSQGGIAAAESAASQPPTPKEQVAPKSTKQTFKLHLSSLSPDFVPLLSIEN